MLLKSTLVAVGAAALIAIPAVVSAHPVGYGDYYAAPYQQNTYGGYSSGYAYGSYGSPPGYGYSSYGNRWAPQAYGSNRGWSGYSRYGARRDYGYGGRQDEREYRGHGHHHHYDEDHHSHYDHDHYDRD